MIDFGREEADLAERTDWVVGKFVSNFCDGMERPVITVEKLQAVAGERPKLGGAALIDTKKGAFGGHGHFASRETVDDEEVQAFTTSREDGPRGRNGDVGRAAAGGTVTAKVGRAFRGGARYRPVTDQGESEQDTALSKHAL